MKTFSIKNLRTHLLVLALVLCAAFIASPNEQGLWAALFTLACYGVLWFVIPDSKPYTASFADWNPSFHDEEPFVAYAEVIEDDEPVENYYLMHESLEKEAYLRQCGTL